MKRSSYRDRDYSFGQAMLTLRATIGLTQTGLADFLGVSRRAVGDWEAGISYPKDKHLKEFITLGFQHKAFQAGHEADEIRALWKASHQKVLFDERWLEELLVPSSVNSGVPASTRTTESGHAGKSNQNVPLSLPFQPTPFVGREAELSEIVRLLRDPACRLLTLLGLGGIGKTRLGIESARLQADAFHDGVTFVPLAPIGAPNQIVSAIGDALNLSFYGQSDPKTHLLNHLRERHMLLVLDNFEHVLEGIDVVYDILLQAQNIMILVTSRIRLNLQAEWLFDVDGLAYPPDGATDLAEFTGYSAVELFLQRVRQVQPRFPVTEAILKTIVRICQQVSGMPLAIELAAAAVRSLSVAQIEAQIRSNLDALTTNLRDVQPRHRSLRAVFDHSWNLLTEPEQALFTRLSIFRGGCTIEAVEAITGANLPVLLSLVDKSLVRQVNMPTQTPGVVESRFSLLEPTREYVWEKLTASGETEALRYAHANYYLQLAESLIPEWYAETLDSSLQKLHREYDNLIAILQWALDGGDRAIAFRLGAALARFWRNRGYLSQGLAWMTELLAVQDDPTDVPLMTARLHATRWAAWLASDRHDFGRAMELLEATMALRQTLGVTEAEETETNLLIVAGLHARAAGHYQQAVSVLEDCLALHRAQGNRESAGNTGIGLTLHVLAGVLRECGEFARSLPLYEECLQLHTELGDQEGRVPALLGLADIYRDQGFTAEARIYTDESLIISRNMGLQWAIGFSLNNLAVLDFLDGNLEQAAKWSGESVALFREIQLGSALGEMLITQANIWSALGNLDGAREVLVEGLQLAQIHGPHLVVATTMESLGGVMVRQNQAALAVQLISAASALRSRIGAPLRPIDQQAIESVLASAREMLGADTFDTDWAAAQERPLEQILGLIFGL